MGKKSCVENVWLLKRACDGETRVRLRCVHTLTITDETEITGM